MKTLKLSFCFFALAISSSAFAALSPVGVAIIPPVQFPPEDYNVTGARISVFWGYSRTVYGLDIGLLGNITELESVGAQISGLFNVNHGMTTGIFQAAGIANYDANKANIFGVQFAGLVNYDMAESSVNGLQLALLANLSEHTTIRGFQVGLYNRAMKVEGLQIGLVNVTDELHGVQIGLLNVNHKGLFYVSPVLNVGF